MPVQSKAQFRYLAINHPDVLKRWQLEAHRNFDNLPEHKPKTAKKASRPKGR